MADDNMKLFKEFVGTVRAILSLPDSLDPHDQRTVSETFQGLLRERKWQEATGHIMAEMVMFLDTIQDDDKRAERILRVMRATLNRLRKEGRNQNGTVVPFPKRDL